MDGPVWRLPASSLDLRPGTSCLWVVCEDSGAGHGLICHLLFLWYIFPSPQAALRPGPGLTPFDTGDHWKKLPSPHQTTKRHRVHFQTHSGLSLGGRFDTWDSGNSLGYQVLRGHQLPLPGVLSALRSCETPQETPYLPQSARIHPFSAPHVLSSQPCAP